MSKNSRSTSRFSRSATWSKNLLFELAADGVQPVHRPVARVVGDLAEPVDVHVLAHPLRRGQLRGRGERPVGDQAEQHPLGRGGVPRPAPPGGGEPGQDLRDAEPVPQLVQDVRAAVGPGLGERQVAVGGGGQRVGRAEQPGQRGDQPPDRVVVELVFAAEAVDDLRHRPAGGGVPFVVGQLQVPDFAVLGLPGGRLHVHRSRPYTRNPYSFGLLAITVSL